MQIGTGQTRPVGSFFSKHHGLVLNDGVAYDNYVVSIVGTVTSGGASIWFLKQSNTPKSLLSAWGGSTRGTEFRFVVSNVLGIEVLSTTYLSDTHTILLNQWHHCLIVWSVSATGITATFVIDGTATGYWSIGGTITPNAATSKLVVGASLTTAQTVIPSTLYDGYIRRLELLDTSSYPTSLSDVQSFLPTIATLYIASKAFVNAISIGVWITICKRNVLTVRSAIDAVLCHNTANASARK